MFVGHGEPLSIINVVLWFGVLSLGDHAVKVESVATGGVTLIHPSHPQIAPPLQSLLRNPFKQLLSDLAASIAYRVRIKLEREPKHFSEP